uniref:F-box domain-containing protein n=1 Tax=Oryza meridionalis TaxID=40149 RepID=A0A0E0CSY8_9ORYZ
MDFEEAAAEIYRLPEECVAYAISMTTPGDACHSSAVSPAFRAAADSDAVWDSFLPPDHAAILARADDGIAAAGECASKKDLFARLCGRPVLLDDATMSFGLDRRSGAKCVMLSARALSIAFPEVAELLDVCWLEITGKLQLSLLSPATTYAAYLVYSFADYTTGLECNIGMPTPMATVTVVSGAGGTSRPPVPAPTTTEQHKICLQHMGEEETIMHRQELVIRLRKAFGRTVRFDPDMDIRCPRMRDGGGGGGGGGWREVELGEFAVPAAGGEDGVVEVSFKEETGRWKTGLIEEAAAAFRRSSWWRRSPSPRRGTQGDEACDYNYCECEIARLPEELLSAAISLTAPRDALRTAAVSRAFRAAADSDAVWASFLPCDLPDLADGELYPAPPSKKDLFLRLSAGHYLLLPDRLKAIHLSCLIWHVTGAKCYVLSARALVIIWTCTPRDWRWIPLTDSRFTEAAELLSVCWLEILGKMDSRMLSPNSTYAAVLVFKIAEEFYQLDTVDATVNLAGTKSSREVALTRFRPDPHEEETAVLFPRSRADDWMEVELGEFFNEEGEDGNVNIRIFGKGPHWKKVYSAVYICVPLYDWAKQGPARKDKQDAGPRVFSWSHTSVSLTNASSTTKHASIEESSSSMEMEEEKAAACEIARLPEELLVEVLSLTGPRDASRAAAVCREFRAAADSDAVWSRFLPRGLPRLARRELPRSPPPPSRKAHFLRLSAGPFLLPRKLMSMWLDREKGAKFTEGAELIDVCWLEIRGRIHSKMLSPNSTYAAYMVFKIADEFYGLDAPFQEASVSLGGRGSTKIVCVQSYDSEDEEVPENYWPMSIGPLLRRRARRRDRRLVLDEGVAVPQKRTDEWMELEMGEFINEEGEDGEVCFSLMETKGGNWKRGLIVQGIEIRLKKSG